MSCFASTIGNSTCEDLLDATCFCEDQVFLGAAEKCVFTECSPSDAMGTSYWVCPLLVETISLTSCRTEVARVEEGACGRSKRSRRLDLLLPLVIEIPAWFFPWLRLYSSWGIQGRVAVDDYMMMACGVRASAANNASRKRANLEARCFTQCSWPWG